MKATNQLLSTVQSPKIFREIGVSSRSGKDGHIVTIYYGGTMQEPRMDCDCIAGIMRQACWHKKTAWESLDGFTKALIIHHEEMKRR